MLAVPTVELLFYDGVTFDVTRWTSHVGRHTLMEDGCRLCHSALDWRSGMPSAEGKDQGNTVHPWT